MKGALGQGYCAERAGPTELLIRSTTIQPRTLGIGADTRNLGVRVYRADILPAEPDDTDPETPEPPEPAAAAR